VIPGLLFMQDASDGLTAYLVVEACDLAFVAYFDPAIRNLPSRSRVLTYTDDTLDKD
jgi:hypothetical protein